MPQSPYRRLSRERVSVKAGRRTAAVASKRGNGRAAIFRQELHRVFVEGVELMRSVQPGARVRPSAFETLEGRWLVHLVRYSALSDPLMTAPAAGNA